jgi:hypothetical protein
MFTVLLPPGGNPIAVDKYSISISSVENAEERENWT